MYQKAADGNRLPAKSALAPEHDPEFALTRYCKETGVVVSMGHSSATYEQAMMGIANGATSMTHVFNGMTPFRPSQSLALWVLPFVSEISTAR